MIVADIEIGHRLQVILTLRQAAGLAFPQHVQELLLCPTCLALCEEPLKLLVHLLNGDPGDKENIMVKAEGNTLRINLSWTLIKEPTSVVTATSPTTVDSTKYPNGVKTPDEQARFLIEDFQSVTLLQQYQVILVENNLTRLGSLEGISLSKSGSTPVTWKANLKFISPGQIIGSALLLLGSVIYTYWAHFPPRVEEVAKDTKENLLP